MFNYEAVSVLPGDIQMDWMAQLHQAVPTEKGVFRLVGVRRTSPHSFEAQRITVLVLDENGFPLPNIPVAFAYDTADRYVLTQDFLWTPPLPHQAFVMPTQGGGQIDQVQGSPVKQGEPGGVTVYIFEPEYASDVVSGAGMLADHTGLHLTFQLRRNDVLPLDDRLQALETRLAVLEGQY